MDYTKLISKIKDIFVSENNFVMKKVVEEFEIADEFVGDMYTFLIYEPLKDNPPRIYQVGGPFDLISKKAPQQALVWENGELILNTNFTDYVDMRTGAMDSLVLDLLGKSLGKQSKVLMYGTGKTALWSVKILKELHPELGAVEYINSSSSEAPAFTKELEAIGVTATPGSKDRLFGYDYIFCHTNAQEVLLTKEDVTKVKPGAVITTFISSTEHGEVADEFYSENANVLIDWENNKERARDLLRATSQGYVAKGELTTIAELINGASIDESKDYTIFRSMGTPMQNLAVLKLLIENGE